MKAFFVVLLLAVATSASPLTEEQKQKLRSYSDICEKDTGVSSDLVKKVRSGDFSVEDEKLNHYFFCMLTKTGIMNDDGVINKEVALTKFNDEADKKNVEKAIDTCISRVGKDKYETAFLFKKCYHEERPNHDKF